MKKRLLVTKAGGVVLDKVAMRDYIKYPDMQKEIYRACKMLQELHNGCYDETAEGMDKFFNSKVAIEYNGTRLEYVMAPALYDGITDLIENYLLPDLRSEY